MFVWSQIRDECLTCRNAVAVFDMSYFGKFYLSGPDAKKAADWLFTADVNKAPGEMSPLWCLSANSVSHPSTLWVSIFYFLKCNHLDCLCVSGSTVYTCMLNKRGGVESDLTVSRLEPSPAHLPLTPESNGKQHTRFILFRVTELMCKALKQDVMGISSAC